LFLCFDKLALLSFGKTDCRSASPWWWCLVNCPVLFLSNYSPRVSIGRVKPTAAEIERRSRRPCNSPRATAKPWASLDDQALHSRRMKSPGCRNAGRTATDDHHFAITICHL
jgi:hypothetical protein